MEIPVSTQWSSSDHHRAIIIRFSITFVIVTIIAAVIDGLRSHWFEHAMLQVLSSRVHAHGDASLELGYYAPDHAGLSPTKAASGPSSLMNELQMQKIRSTTSNTYTLLSYKHHKQTNKHITPKRTTHNTTKQHQHTQDI